MHQIAQHIQTCIQDGTVDPRLVHVPFHPPDGFLFIGCLPAKTAKIDVRDIAGVAALALTEAGHEGKAYELTGPENVSLSDLAETLSAAVGRKITYNQVSQAEMKRGLMAVGATEFFADIYVDIYGAGYYGTGQGACITNTVQELTGQPPLNFTTWAADFAPLFKKPVCSNFHTVTPHLHLSTFLAILWWCSSCGSSSIGKLVCR